MLQFFGEGDNELYSLQIEATKSVEWTAETGFWTIAFYQALLHDIEGLS